jgi:hypothetical protein
MHLSQYRFVLLDYMQGPGKTCLRKLMLLPKLDVSLNVELAYMMCCSFCSGYGPLFSVHMIERCKIELELMFYMP